MKRFELFFTALQLPIDYVALILAGFTAYSLRYATFVTAIRPVLFNLSWAKYWPVVLMVALAWIVIFAFSGMYSTNPNRKFARDATRIVTASSTGFAAITIYVFFTLQKFDSRFLVLASWLLAMVYVLAGRLIVRGVKTLLYRSGAGLRRVVIIGEAKLAETLKNTFASDRTLGYTMVAAFPHFNAEVAATLQKNIPDEIFFTDPKARESEALLAIDFANTNHVTFKYTADFFATISSNFTVNTIAGVPVVELRRTRLTGWGRIIKRTLDIILSAILLLILSPFYLLFSIVILLETGRPILYKNERVGQVGEKFFTLKFRTMFKEASTGAAYGGEAALQKEQELIKTQNSKEGPIYKIKNDPRITRFGRWLRRYSMDELPQFWNVLKGEMSLVGPRPHQPREVQGYGTKHSIVFTLKPGITGLAQISGRSDLSFEDEMKLDAFYIEHWNLYLDFIILLKTPFVVLLRKGSIV